MNQRWTRGGTRNRTKVTAIEIAAIRQWARSEGFGLSPWAQAGELTTKYPLRREALVDILTNRSFYDPQYQRDVPLVLEEAAVSCPWLFAWLVTWLLLFRTYGIGAPTPLFNPAYYEGAE